MQYDYIITLQKKNTKLPDFIARLLLLLAITSLIYSTFFNTTNRWLLLGLAAGIAAWWSYCQYNTGKKQSIFFRFAFLLAAIGFYLPPIHNLWLASLYTLAALLEKQVKFPEEIGFSANGIVFNSFPKKQHTWSELSQVVLKDGMLTIDFKNNKLFQKETEDVVNGLLEQEFNEFCRSYLNR